MVDSSKRMADGCWLVVAQVVRDKLAESRLQMCLFRGLFSRCSRGKKGFQPMTVWRRNEIASLFPSIRAQRSPEPGTPRAYRVLAVDSVDAHARNRSVLQQRHRPHILVLAATLLASLAACSFKYICCA